MFDGRFAHGVIQKDNYVYALAGNSYGKGPESTMRFCERYNLQQKKWEQIGNLNNCRCAMVTTIWQNQLMIAGGFSGKQQMASIEIFNEGSRNWDKMGLMLVEPVESMVSFKLNDNELLMLGGKTKDNQDCKKIWKYQIIAETPDASHGEEIGQLQSTRSLMTCMKFDEESLILVGGNAKTFEFISLQTYKPLIDQKYQTIEHKLNAALTEAGFAGIGFKKNLIVGFHQ